MRESHKDGRSAAARVIGRLEEGPLNAPEHRIPRSFVNAYETNVFSLFFLPPPPPPPSTPNVLRMTRRTTRTSRAIEIEKSEMGEITGLIFFRYLWLAFTL